MEKEAKEQKIVKLFIENNILLSNEVLPSIYNLSEEEALDLLKKISNVEDFFIFDKELFDKLKRKESDTGSSNVMQMSKSLLLNSEKKSLDNRGEVKILSSYNQKSIKREVSHFVSYFRQRYKALEQILIHRKEVQNRLSILRIKGKKEKEEVAAIGMVIGMQLTKNGNIMLTLEDLTGSINVLINKNRSDELFNAAKNIVFDEVIGVGGGCFKRNYIFKYNNFSRYTLNKGISKVTC